jgi:hypothetical protein
MSIKISALGSVLALGLSTGFAAAQATSQQQQLAVQPSPMDTMHYGTYDPYGTDVNPAMGGTTGQYSQSDLYTNRQGFAVGGWSQLNNPPS